MQKHKFACTKRAAFCLLASDARAFTCSKASSLRAGAESAQTQKALARLHIVVSNCRPHLRKSSITTPADKRKIAARPRWVYTFSPKRPLNRYNQRVTVWLFRVFCTRQC